MLLGVFTGFVRRARHDRRTQPGIGRQHPVKARPVQARARHQRRQALQTTHPEVPTVAESGGPPGYESGLWVGLFALRGAPEGAMQRLSADIAKVLAEQEVKDRFRAIGLEASVNTPAEIAALIRADLKRNADLVKRIGITPE